MKRLMLFIFFPMIVFAEDTILDSIDPVLLKIPIVSETTIVAVAVYQNVAKPILEGEQKHYKGGGLGGEEYKTWEILEIEEQRRKDEERDVRLNQQLVREGIYWVDGRWVNSSTKYEPKFSINK